MGKMIIDRPVMEKPDHKNHRFPLTEFVDLFDSFANRSFSSHWHHELEIQIILEGCAEYTVNGTSYVVKAGNAIYIAPEVVHMARALEENTIGYDIVLLPRVLIDLMHSIGCEKYSLPLTTQWPEAVLITADRKENHSILESMKRMYYTDSAHFTYELVLLESLISIWRNLISIFPQHGRDTKDSSKALREQRMKVMLDYIWKNYTQPVTIQDIASAASVSKSECFRCFAELSKVSPMEYINQYRLQQAANLLVLTSKSISDICYSAGFNSSSYFSKKFNEQYGMSPKAYRASRGQR